MTPQTERKGKGEGKEVGQGVAVDEGIKTGLIAPLDDSLEPEAKAPTKQVVFRSTDRSLRLYQKAGYIDKSHGLASYIPSTGVEFEEYYKKLDDIPENAFVIEWIRKHPTNGTAFIEVPDISNMIELPTIAQMEQMTLGELRDLCVKHQVKVETDTGKDSLVLALLKGVQKQINAA